MASSRPVHEVSPAGAGSPAVGGPSVTPGHGFSPEGDSILAELQNLCEQETTGGAGRVDPTAASAHTCLGRSTTGVNEEEDAGFRFRGPRGRDWAQGGPRHSDAGPGARARGARSPDSAPTQPTALR
ncbi:hypothetical protein MTO96_042140 [Rhipicephalus appendiculatus]